MFKSFIGKIGLWLFKWSQSFTGVSINQLEMMRYSSTLIECLNHEMEISEDAILLLHEWLENCECAPDDMPEDLHRRTRDLLMIGSSGNPLL